MFLSEGGSKTVQLLEGTCIPWSLVLFSNLKPVAVGWVLLTSLVSDPSSFVPSHFLTTTKKMFDVTF